MMCVKFTAFFFAELTCVIVSSVYLVAPLADFSVKHVAFLAFLFGKIRIIVPVVLASPGDVCTCCATTSLQEAVGRHFEHRASADVRVVEEGYLLLSALVLRTDFEL